MFNRPDHPNPFLNLRQTDAPFSQLKTPEQGIYLHSGNIPILIILIPDTRAHSTVSRRLRPLLSTSLQCRDLLISAPSILPVVRYFPCPYHHFSICIRITHQVNGLACHQNAPSGLWFTEFMSRIRADHCLFTLLCTFKTTYAPISSRLLRSLDFLRHLIPSISFSLTTPHRRHLSPRSFAHSSLLRHRRFDSSST